VEEETSDYLKKPMEVMDNAIAAGTWTSFVRPVTAKNEQKFPRNNKSDPIDLKVGE